MKILARGSENQLEELKVKLGVVSCDLTCMDESDLLFSANVQDYDVIFDLKFDEKFEQLKYFAPLKEIPVFVSAVKRSLAGAFFDFAEPTECLLIGINALPGCINKPLAELSLFNDKDADRLMQCMQLFKWEYKLVKDRVGMVTPRVIFMIINEACFTLQEGTATMNDIDTSMKLGTNYPFGPFEWADKIGIKNVYETLDALWTDTHDERYKICPLLKTHYLKNKSFYQ